jgi:hypothetical protein
MRNVLFPLSMMLAFFCLLAGCQSAGSQRGWVQYPEEKILSLSPNGIYRVENEGTYDTGYRCLFLVNTKTGNREILLEYTNNATVKWSPRGDKLLVNIDCSSEMTPFVFIPNLGTKIDLRERFEESPYSNLVEDAVHWYAEGVAWLGDSRVRINVFGHGDNSFSRNFVYGLTEDVFIPE